MSTSTKTMWSVEICMNCASKMARTQKISFTEDSLLYFLLSTFLNCSFCFEFEHFHYWKLSQNLLFIIMPPLYWEICLNVMFVTGMLIGFTVFEGAIFRFWNSSIKDYWSFCPEYAIAAIANLCWIVHCPKSQALQLDSHSLLVFLIPKPPEKYKYLFIQRHYSWLDNIYT